MIYVVSKTEKKMFSSREKLPERSLKMLFKKIE